MTVSFDPRSVVAKTWKQGQQDPGADGTQGAVGTGAMLGFADVAADRTLSPGLAAAFQAAGQAGAEPAPAPYAMFSAASAVAPAAAAPSVGTGTTGSSAPATAAAAAANPSAAPSWVGTLSTASIAADMTAADVNGTVTYSGLKTLLTDLDATLTSSRTTLTAAELSDLRKIAANLDNGMTTSSYLTGIMNGVVNANAANATWTGGAASSTALGNLAAGSSATQLSELVGKWFLGTDLPSSKVSMGGAPTFSVSYSASSGPLFGSTGPSMSDVNQGYLGDCYLLSSLAEVAKQNSGIISSMFTADGNNTYGVRYFVNGVAEYVTVNNSLTSAFNSGTDIWASLAEKAYAQLQAGGVVTGNSVNAGNSWTTIGNGGAPEFALEEITGASAITDFSSNRSSWSTTVYNSSFAVTKYSTGGTAATVLGTLAADLAQGDDLVLSSWTNATDSSGRTTLVADHAMSIYGYDSTTGMLEVRNPWGTESGQTWDTTFEVSLSTLQADGDTITVDNMGTGPAAPTLTAQTATQTWRLGAAVNFALPATTFTDPHAQKLTYSATLASGQALPSWLSFNATTGTFTGTVPNTAAGLSLKITATDTSGLSASETFSVLTPATAPVLAVQTATQTWRLGQAVSFAVPATTFTDPQAEKLTYSATLSTGAALPSWLSFNASTDTFTGTVPNTAAGLSLKVTATDTSGLSASDAFSVLTPATAPVLAVQTATQTWRLGQAVSFALPATTFTDPQAEKLTYSATLSNGAALPSWLSFNASTDTFTGTVPNSAAGLSLKVTATDTSGLSASDTFSVLTPAAAPALAVQTANQSWATGKAVTLALPAGTFTDPQHETLTYAATQANGTALPAWLKFTAATETFSGTAPISASTLSLKVTATDTSGLSVSETFTATIAAVAAQFTQTISSLVSGAASAGAGLQQLASVPAPTLASPVH
ncbi:MAG: putative Ig domain-containing protein [Xanthobacteraceae bacterium]|jgi:DNA polymerase III psi subunit